MKGGFIIPEGTSRVHIGGLADQDEELKEGEPTLTEDVSAGAQDAQHSSVMPKKPDSEQPISTDEPVPHFASTPSSLPQDSEAADFHASGSKGMHDILHDLLRAHEESLRVNRRLLEALGKTHVRS